MKTVIFLNNTSEVDTDTLMTEEEQLICTSGSRPKKKHPIASSQQHRPYPPQKAETAEKAAFDPSKTTLGKLFLEGNATADSLPALRKKKDLKGKAKAPASFRS